MENRQAAMPNSDLTKTALLILAEGAEEMEAVIIADILRRGGITVTIAGLEGTGPVKCSRNVVLLPDDSLENALQKQSLYDCVVLPGGLHAAELYSKSGAVGDVLRHHDREKRIVAAICAAPLALVAHGIGVGKTITAYPTVTEDIPPTYNVKDSSLDKYVIDENIVTSPGPGLTFLFALKLVELLAGRDEEFIVEKTILYTGPF